MRLYDTKMMQGWGFVIPCTILRARRLEIATNPPLRDHFFWRSDPRSRTWLAVAKSQGNCGELSNSMIPVSEMAPTEETKRALLALSDHLGGVELPIQYITIFY